MIPRTSSLALHIWDSLSPEWQHAIRESIESDEVADAGLIYYFETLENLDLSYTQIQDLSPVKYFPNLKVLEVSATPVRDFSALQYLPQLEELHAAYCQPFPLELLTHTPQLTVLDLSYPNGPLRQTPFIEQLSNLEELFLNRTGITSVMDLLMLEKLRVLSLSFNKLDDTERAYLRDILPTCHILF